MKVKNLSIYWLSSISIAIPMYYVLRYVNNGVFGSWYRMIRYHEGNPIPFILIVCFFYGFIALFFTSKFANQKSIKGKIALSLLVAILSIIASSPFGGMLWHYYDMKAGWFPKNWLNKLLNGAIEGLYIGWFIILLSIPYNILGLIVNYFILDKVSKSITK